MPRGEDDSIFFNDTKLDLNSTEDEATYNEIILKKNH